jgi:3-phosphoshikimate 1-carboxyvinyltransferase
LLETLVTIKYHLLNELSILSSSLRFIVQPGGTLCGTVQVPGDKSISHRAIMFAALAEGTSRISGCLLGDDVLATLQAFRAMGVMTSDEHQPGDLSVEGVGMHGLQPPSQPLDLGNSGTSIRLLSGLLAGQGIACTLSGDASLCSRPMLRVTEPLAQMGAQIVTTDAGCAPLQITPVKPLTGITYTLPVASAQVKSCVLLAGLYADGDTQVIEPAPTRDHTERMLEGFGYPVWREGSRCGLSGGGRLHACDIHVPADISSAAFFLVGASLAKGSDLTLRRVGMNPTRDGVITILCLMGADIQLFNQTQVGGEPVADIRVRSADLQGIHVPLDQVPLAIDEFPALFVAAACASGETVLRGAKELRVKESDRIQVMADGLQALGVQVEVLPDGMVIQGGGMQGGVVHSRGDHRIAMAFAMAALGAQQRIIIEDCANVNTSFPGFVDLAASVGLRVEASDV